jgi:hypothetical protein
VLGVVLLLAPQVRAHELAIDQLTLFPDVRSGHLRGQILFDPKLTRENGEKNEDVIAPRVLTFLRENLRIELDGRPIELRMEVRELWMGDGAIGGDSVMLDGSIPPETRELRVFAGKPLRALAVSVESPGAAERAAPKNTLLLGGDTTPPYRFARTAPNAGWSEGDPELLAIQVPPHLDRKNVRASPKPSPPAVAPSPAVGFAEPSAWQTLVRYMRLGFVHILPSGLDHLLFVAGLVLGSRRRPRALLFQIGAFTLAHTLTLGLGALGLVVLSPRIVEPLIALSIAFVAIENLVKKGEPRYRAAWAFGFGLLHGQGFASGLIATGIPRDSFLTALFSFNVGVELGQLVVILGLLLVLRGFREPERFYRFVVRPGSIAIAMAALYWGVERLVA